MHALFAFVPIFMGFYLFIIIIIFFGSERYYRVYGFGFTIRRSLWTPKHTTYWNINYEILWPIGDKMPLWGHWEIQNIHCNYVCLLKVSYRFAKFQKVYVYDSVDLGINPPHPPWTITPSFSPSHFILGLNS